ncbi:MAG: Asp-tRNA(Asn)/Glu-tRNA(Gln) amidotransferase subunit GatA [Saprospiraceae bacterium]|nr:Asp-tRNA(Asn)/Glu-tRNA(Gln) amidotransferase subunit GatA [Saprospiraceae bacterium]
MQNITSIQTALRQNQITCIDVVQYYLQRIDETYKLNIYLEVFDNEAKTAARIIDEKLRTGAPLGRLFGCVISIKDVICYKNHKVSAGSKILENFVSPYSSTAVERLLAEDAIIIGRTNCDQFAMGSTNEHSHYGPTMHAVAPNLIPGGSSGGAAVSVQASTCTVALGSDTGGSVRQPAAFCSTIGFKPTYGRISRHGLLAYASSFDQIGIISNTIEDIALVTEVMAGVDEYDATSSEREVPHYSQEITKKANCTYKVAYISEAIQHEGIDPEIRECTENYLKGLTQKGISLHPISFEYLDYIIPTYYVLTTAEASSNLSRYDGVRYGFRHPDATSLEEIYTMTRSEGFNAEVKKRIMLGTFVLSAGYYDAYYAKAQKIRNLIRQKTLDIFESYDFIIMPVSPVPAWEIGKKMTNPVEMYLADIFTVLSNMAGIGSISIPIGIHSNKSGIGIQILAPPFQETNLFSFCSHIISK